MTDVERVESPPLSDLGKEYLKRELASRDHIERVLAKLHPNDPQYDAEDAKRDALVDAGTETANRILAADVTGPGELAALAWLVLLDGILEVPDAARRGDASALPARIELKEDGDQLSPIAEQAAVNLALAVLTLLARR
jgi:hypothetical protein